MLEELQVQQQKEIEAKRKEYEGKRSEVLQRLQEKHQNELMECLSSMQRIELTLHEKQLRHD